MCRRAIIQLVSPHWARRVLRIARGRLPLARWYSGAVLRHPRGESALLATTEAARAAKPVPKSIPELLRNVLQKLRWELSPVTK
jgi:hypothetical protein